MRDTDITGCMKVRSNYINFIKKNLLLRSNTHWHVGLSLIDRRYRI